MANQPLFSVDLPALFAAVNASRTRSGLPVVEPAVIGIKASIKLIVSRNKHLEDLNTKECVMEAEDVAALQKILYELFNVTVDPRAAISERTPKTYVAPTTPVVRELPESENGPIEKKILFLNLCEAINVERRARRLLPVEPAVIQVRIGIRYSIMCGKELPVQEGHLFLNRHDQEILNKIISEQFSVTIPKAAYVVHRRETSNKNNSTTILNTPISKILKNAINVILHKNYDIHLHDLVLAIIYRRMRFGHKTMSSKEIAERCRRLIEFNLDIEIDAGESFCLTPEEMTRLGGLIKQEFEIVFEDLVSLLESRRS